MANLLEKLERALHEKKASSRSTSPAPGASLSPRRAGARTPKSRGSLTPPSREHELDYDDTRRCSHGALTFDETRRPSHTDRLPGTPPPIGTSHDPPHHVILDPSKKPVAMLCTNCRRQMSYESGCKLCPEDYAVWCHQCVRGEMYKKHNAEHTLYDLTIRRPRYVGGYVPANCSSCGKHYEIAHDHYTGARCNKCEEKHLDICGACLDSQARQGYKMLIQHEEEFHKDEPASWTLFKGPGIVMGQGPAAKAGW